MKVPGALCPLLELKVSSVCMLVAQSYLTLCYFMDVAHQAPLSLEFSRQSYGVGCHFLLQQNSADSGIEPGSPALQVESFLCRGLPHSSLGKESTCNAGDPSLTPVLGRSLGEGKGYPLQYSGLENSMDCIVHGVAKSQTLLRDFHFLFVYHMKHQESSQWLKSFQIHKY